MYCCHHQLGVRIRYSILTKAAYQIMATLNKSPPKMCVNEFKTMVLFCDILQDISRLCPDKLVVHLSVRITNKVDKIKQTQTNTR